MIPIKNIYYMLLYAFDQISNKSVISDKDLEKLHTINDVVSFIFLSEVSRIVKKGLIKQYIDVEENSYIIKGKIDVKNSLRLHNRKKKCTFDDYNFNNQLNSILKYTLNILVFASNDDIKRKARKLYIFFNEIQLVKYSFEDVKKIRFDRLSKDYEYAIKLASFIISCSIPDYKINKFKFIDFFENDEIMSIIFEKFLLNFYKIHTEYRVKGNRKIKWYLSPINISNTSKIPNMETDIEIEFDQTKIIIDAKYYKNAFTNRYGAQKHISTNMYQINTYLIHNINNYDNLRGILIYPSNGYSFNNQYHSSMGFTMEFYTVDLNNDWSHIEQELLNII